VIAGGLRFGQMLGKEECMTGKAIAASVGTLLVIVMCASATLADKARVKGMITARTGDTLIVKSRDGNTTTVVLTDDTRTNDNVGLLGMTKKELSNVVLIPGLKVDVDGSTDDQGHVVAKTITVDGDDVETAQMIEAGLHPTAQQVEANVRAIQAHEQQLQSHDLQLATQKQSIQQNQADIAAHTQQIQESMQAISENTNRFMSLNDYDVKGQLTVQFKSGSSTIEPTDAQDLVKLAEKAKSITGYLIEVIGYADSTGAAKMNTTLSEQRAIAVITVLVQQAGVPVRCIVAPGAMGEYGAVASNETPEGRAQNRRAEVKVLVSRGTPAP
jgi:OOP family OmpA-OmpF porin